VIAGGILLTVLCAGWVVPLFVLSGGVGQYVIASRELSSLVASLTSVTAHGLPALAGNVSFLGSATATSAGLAPAAFTVFLLPGVRWPWRPSRPQRLFLWLWAAPALLVYTCLHTGQAGYLLLLWPLVCYASATALLTAAAVLARRIGAGEHRVAGVLLAACALTSAALFLVAPLSPRQAPGGMMASSIRETDAFWRGVQRDLGAYSPAETVILTGTTSAESFRHATYYLPAYRVYAVGLDREGDLGVAFRGYRGEHDYDRFMAGDAAEPALTLPPGTRRLVILDESIARLFPKTARQSVDATPFRDYWVVETGDGARTLTLPRYASVS
jgi:hypothetical protein